MLGQRIVFLLYLLLRSGQLKLKHISILGFQPLEFNHQAGLVALFATNRYGVQEVYQVRRTFLTLLSVAVHKLRLEAAR
ncbi:MAG: hypothetical protein OQL18_02315, partial [Deltaproteobacteria bacterium]|nr:hypothetical protein [Deltaproteobacteria bacterium]